MVTIEHEHQVSGCYYTFCPLASIGWLHRKIRNSFYLVIGSPLCSAFLQNAFGVMLFAQPRFATAVLEEKDLYQGVSFQQLREIVDHVVSSYEVEVLFMISSCVAQLLKLELSSWAQRLSDELHIPVLSIPVSGLDASFVQGEDVILSALIDLCPSRPFKKDNVVFLGSVASTWETELAYELRELDRPVQFIPPPAMEALPVLNERTTAIFLQPYLGQTYEKVKARGCRVVPTLLPFGASATRQFLEAIYEHCNALSPNLRARLAEREAKVLQVNQTLQEKIAGRRFFFMPDTNLEVPLARFLLEQGGSVVELATPSMNADLLSQELAQLERYDVKIIIGADYYRQQERLTHLQPDLVISPLALSNPLSDQGYRVKLSMDFLLLPLHGFGAHKDLVTLFVQALES